MGVQKFSTVSLAVLFILGCTPGKSPDSPPPAPKTVFDPLTQQLKQAHDVQGTVDRNTDGTRQAVDNQERGDSTP